VTGVVFGDAAVLVASVTVAAILVSRRLGFSRATLFAAPAFVLSWIVLGGHAFLSTAFLDPSFGIVNLWTCWGARPGAVAWGAWIVAAGLVWVGLIRRTKADATIGSAAAASTLLVLLVATSSSPDMVLVPLAVLAIAGAESG
jgi:hypothetical protein